MKTLFGLQIFPEQKHLTDEEFVFQTRDFLAKYEGWRKWLLGLHVVGAAGTIFLIGYGVRLAAQMAPILQGVPGAQEMWFVLGLVTGWIAGHLLSAAVHSFIVTVADTKDIRTKRLLVRYHDECMAGCPADVPVDEAGDRVGHSLSPGTDF